MYWVQRVRHIFHFLNRHFLEDVGQKLRQTSEGTVSLWQIFVGQICQDRTIPSHSFVFSGLLCKEWIDFYWLGFFTAMSKASERWTPKILGNTDNEYTSCKCVGDEWNNHCQSVRKEAIGRPDSYFEFWRFVQAVTCDNRWSALQRHT